MGPWAQYDATKWKLQLLEIVTAVQRQVSENSQQRVIQSKLTELKQQIGSCFDQLQSFQSALSFKMAPSAA